MIVTLSGSKKEMLSTLTAMEFTAGKLELSTPEVIAAEVVHTNGNAKRHMSDEARARIGAAQRARWAKERKQR